MENYHFERIQKAIQFIAQNYKGQPNLEEVAAHVHLSKFHFQRLFHQWTGVSPKQFLQFITIEHAKSCLEAGRSTLATAHEVGLSGNGRLHDLFVKIEACTPGEFQKKNKGKTIQYARIITPFGEALVAETTVGICLLSFLEEETPPLTLLSQVFPEAHFQNELGKNSQLVQSYFSNWQIPSQKIVLDLKGTSFQMSVWKALLSIPPSQLLAYNDIAQMIDKPRAVRAVGTAIGKNPIAYLIPCHRVIRETGEMGGYRWGSERKLFINAYEQID